MRVAYILLSEQSDATMTDWIQSCYRLTPMMAKRQPSGLFLEIGRCRKLYDEDTLALRLKVIAKRLQTKVRISLGDSIPEALARNELCSQAPLTHMPVHTLHACYAPFAREYRERPAVDLLIQQLDRLGIRSIRQFQQLPNHEVGSRFGSLAKRLYLVLNQPKALLWPKLVIDESVEESFTFAEELQVTSLNGIQFVLNDMIQKITLRLVGLGKRVSSLLLTLTFDDYSIHPEKKREIVFKLSHPQGYAKSIFRIVYERLERNFQDQRLHAPIRSLHLAVTETAPRKTSQRDLLHKKEDQEESMHELLNRLSDRLGKQAPFFAENQACYLPEAGWIKRKKPAAKSMPAPQPTKQTYGFDVRSDERLAYGKRPLRMLATPVPLKRLGKWLFSKRKRWLITKWQGPERLTGKWWQQRFLRDYYQVETASEERLWIFVDGQKKVYLHGFFDGL